MTIYNLKIYKFWRVVEWVFSSVEIWKLWKANVETKGKKN